MSEKKPGFFGRLFGRGKSDAENEAKDSASQREDANAPHEIEPGPPETTSEWVEKPHQDKDQPETVEDTPKAPQREEHPHASPAPPEATLHPPHHEDEQAEVATKPVAETPAEPVAPPPAPEEPIEPEHLTKPSLAPEDTVEPAPPTVAEVETEAVPAEEPKAEIAASAAEPAPEPAPEPEPEPEQPRSWFGRLTSGLKRTSDNLTGNLTALFTKRKLDEETLEELEDVLIQADLGIETAMSITEALAKDRYDKEVSAEDVRTVLASEVEKVLEPVARPLDLDKGHKPHIILMIGVNGSGKTTTIGKLAQKYTAEGKKVMLAAGDTFRAAAIEQLQVWGQRTGAPVVSRPAGADASGLAFDAVTEAKANGSDILIIDTAGRLQNRDELMAELEKIIRVIKKVDETAPHTVLLTLDATTGQNAMNQVEIFGKRGGVTGLVMTKLDGTARGGILVAIAKKHALPVHFIGVGESAGDLQPFEAKDFAAAISGVAQ